MQEKLARAGYTLKKGNRYISLHPISTIVKATPPKPMNTAWQLLEADLCVTRLLTSGSSLCFRGACLPGWRLWSCAATGRTVKDIFRHELRRISAQQAPAFLWALPFTHEQWSGRFSALTRSQQHSNLRRAFRWEMLQQYSFCDRDHVSLFTAHRRWR